MNTLCVDVEIFESGKKNLRIQKYPDTGGRDLEKCPTYRELTCCHRFSCRPVLLISCVVVRPSCIQKWILLEWLFSVLPFPVFPTQGMQAIADTK